MHTVFACFVTKRQINTRHVSRENKNKASVFLCAKYRGFCKMLLFRELYFCSLQITTFYPVFCSKTGRKQIQNAVLINRNRNVISIE